jgi:hypothetical protein
MHHEDISGVCCIFTIWPYPQLVDVFHYDNHITLLFVHGIDVAMYPHPLIKVEGSSHMTSTQKGFKGGYKSSKISLIVDSLFVSCVSCCHVFL